MGDISVDFFLETLNYLLTSSNLDFIIDEKHQLQSLAEEIKYLRRFLQITETKRNEHQEVMDLVMRIRNVVSEAENVVELFMVLVFKANRASDSLVEHQDHLSLDLTSVKRGLETVTAEVKHILNVNMYDINGLEVQKLKQSSSGSRGASSSSRGRNTSKVVEEKMVVGFKDQVETLMGKLHDSVQGGQLEIISIIGAGGGGKTTLAREVYDHPLTSLKFEVCAWINVSQDYNKRDMLISILESPSLENREDYDKSTEDILGEKVHKCLKGRKYLIVMDDIWSSEAWINIQRSFPNEGKGSKVLFTGRQLVVQPANDFCIHRLAPLHASCSWELLQKKVFGEEKCPLELVDIGKQIAENCSGLPLAIVAIAGILASEDKTLDMWKEFSKNLSSIIAKNKDAGCLEILELSYNHLPLHLKACFLYIGAHHEYHEISVRELTWLWIAEGFIQQSKGEKSLEAVAEEYLKDLIGRSLVMVARKTFIGKNKACRIHDLLHELCLKIVEKDNFLVHSFSPSTTNMHRRLFIGGQLFPEFSTMVAEEKEKFSSSLCAQNVRSILCSSLPTSSISGKDLSFFVENFQLLRVLHFISTTSLGEIGIGDLVHLRYLALRLPEGSLLCSSIPFLFLSNLEILNLQVSYMDKISLSRDIVKMVRLRHLYSKWGIFECHHVYDDEDERNMLDSLQTLHRMCICERCLCFLKRTPNLMKLRLVGDNVSMLPNLEFLKCLEILYVDAGVERMPMSSTGLKLPLSLTRLTLRRTHLEWKELSIILQNLSSLEVLKLLYNACCGPIWDTSELEEWSSGLKYLRLSLLDIEEWNAFGDQFPKLEVLMIGWCRNLMGIPTEFSELNELREIQVHRCNRDVEVSAREIQKEQRETRGDDACRVSGYDRGWR